LARPPGEEGARIPKIARHGNRDSRRHRATPAWLRHQGWTHRPGNGFDDMEKGDGIGFDPLRSGQNSGSRASCSLSSSAGAAARVLDFVGRCRDIRPNGLGPGDHCSVAGKSANLQSVYSS